MRYFLICFLITVFSSSAYAILRYDTTIDLVTAYDNNIYLSSENEKEDYRNIIILGVGANDETSLQELSARYSLSLNKFWRNEVNDYAGHNLEFDFERKLTRHISVRFADTYYLSEEPLEEDPEITALRRERNRYARNRAEAGLSYQFGHDDFLRINYLDSRLQNQATDVEDSVEYGPIIEMTYWFNVHHGIDLGYSWNRIEYEESDPLKRDLITAGYSYRYRPNTTLTVNYSLEFFHAYDELDYNNHIVMLGVEHSLSPQWTIGGALGQFFWDPEAGDSENGLVYEAHIRRYFESTSLSLAGTGGSREEYTDAESRGFTKYRSLNLSMDHEVSSRTSINLNVNYHHEKTLSREFLRDDIWSYSGNISYRLYRWLTCSFELSQRERNSSDPLREYRDFTALIRLQGVYEWR